MFVRWTFVQNRVRELRKEYKLKQEELAAKINVSQQTISRIEKEENSLPADTLVDLAKYFDVSVDYILYLSDFRKTNEYVIEFNRMMEENYELCRLYGRLDKAQQELIMRMAEELAGKVEKNPM